MEIKNFKEGDEYQIFKLFELVFERPMNPEYWYWRFQNNPAGKHMIKLMWSGETLVGHYAVSPVQMSVNNTTVLGALSMTTMTHPDYGRRGIFGSLAEALYKDLEENKNVQAIWGFPNNNSHYGFIKKLKWNDLGVINHLIKDSEKIESEKNSNIKLCKVFNNNHENIIKSITSNFDVKVDRNAKYLNWRFNDNPNVEYITFEYTENMEVEAFLVVKKYPTEEEGVYNIFIVENGIPFEKLELLPKFLSHIKNHFEVSIKTFNIWLSLFDKRHIYLERNGFLIGGRPTYLGSRNQSENQNILKDFRNWYFSYSDSDVY
ncbi:GNAT family N-acetyltransferase [Tenacibaculum sp. M341]|uniref:GNAT family N-acetyltransferase n=1 Tax=Tenacibaculum sp. M341 TaxID=2530339 RepID=UPI0010497A71|nr:GNAT family N-acetyltransferase [Tenacibaculum sp. M341]TCI91743.1 GNAT family N-acetyltransferase [Tenacibaculum sp. M341]